MAGPGTFDDSVMALIAGHRSPLASTLARDVMAVGATHAHVSLAALLALALVVAVRAYRPALAALISLALATGASELLKLFFGRARPPELWRMVEIGGPSFPSTQAAETAALVAAVLVTISWRGSTWGRVGAAVLLGLVGLVGWCMVYLGAHWPTDVLAGWVLGAAVGVVVARLVTRVWNQAQERRTASVRG